MKLSALIKKLRVALKEHGDADVVVYDENYNSKFVILDVDAVLESSIALTDSNIYEHYIHIKEA